MNFILPHFIFIIEPTMDKVSLAFLISFNNKNFTLNLNTLNYLNYKSLNKISANLFHIKITY